MEASLRERWWGAAFSLLATVVVVAVAGVEILTVMAIPTLQGLIAGILNRRRRTNDSGGRAWMRVAFLSPILLMPVLYWIFRARCVWPIIAAWVSWTLGGTLPGLKSLQAKEPDRF